MRTKALCDMEEAEGKLKKLLNKVLVDARRLMVLQRKCKDVYRFEVPDNGTEFNDKEHEEQGSEYSDDILTDPKIGNIVSCFSAALVKIPEHNLEQRIMLEKAEEADGGSVWRSASEVKPFSLSYSG